MSWEPWSVLTLTGHPHLATAKKKSLVIWWFQWWKDLILCQTMFFSNTFITSDCYFIRYAVYPNKHTQMPTSSATNGFFRNMGVLRAIPNPFVQKTPKKHRIKMLKIQMRKFVTTVGKQNHTKCTYKIVSKNVYINTNACTVYIFMAWAQNHWPKSWSLEY